MADRPNVFQVVATPEVEAAIRRQQEHLRREGIEPSVSAAIRSLVLLGARKQERLQT